MTEVLAAPQGDQGPQDRRDPQDLGVQLVRQDHLVKMDSRELADLLDLQEAGEER